MTTTVPLDQPIPPGEEPAPRGGFRIDQGLDAVTTRVPAASREELQFSSIHKFQPRNSFNYRVDYEPKLTKTGMEDLFFESQSL